MKKLMVLMACAMSFGYSQAQIAAYKQTSGNIVDGYTLPRTVVNVVVTQEREVIMRGPYARYASQYLGIIGAAQTDKQIFRILNVEITSNEEPDPANTFFFDAKNGAPVRVFKWLHSVHSPSDSGRVDVNYDEAKLGNQNPFTDIGATIFAGAGDGVSADRTSAVAKNPEQMAAEAAATIFKIRKKRIEIICAEQGENVFGAGLSAALKEMDRLEQEYLSLFTGKRFTQVTKRVYSVVPVEGQNRIVVCRFTDSKGVVDPSDLSAAPVTLELKQINDGGSNENLKASGRMLPIRVPKMVDAKVIVGDAVLDSEILSIFQFGGIIRVPVI